MTPRGAIVAVLVACLVLLPVFRAAGELHHAFAHPALSEHLAHGAHGHPAHVEQAPADAGSLLHALMHLPAAGVETAALLQQVIAPDAVSRAALPRGTQPSPCVALPAPGLPFRPPIVA